MRGRSPGHGEVAPASREEVSDYAGFDFSAEWKGRDRVTELERQIVREALAHGARHRILEVGVGFGRLTETVRRNAATYVGLDLDAGQLARTARSLPDPERPAVPSVFVEGNAYHIPSVDGAFDAAVVVRILHHLGDLDRFFTEVGRCLTSGGRLLLQYSPKPTVGTLVMDLRQALRHPSPDRRPITWSGPSWRRVAGERFPIYVGTDAFVRAALERAGFRTLRAWGTGPERLQTGIPWLGQHAYPPIFPLTLALPSRFVLAARDAEPGEAPIPTGFLACPRCHHAVDRTIGGSPWSWTCPTCGFRIAWDGDVVRARIAPG